MFLKMMLYQSGILYAFLLLTNFFATNTSTFLRSFFLLETIFSCELCDYTSDVKSDLKIHSIRRHSPNNVPKPDLEAQKDHMSVIKCEPDWPETHISGADQNDQKCFVQVNVIEGTKEIEIKEELEIVLVKEELDVVPDDPLYIVKQEPF
jgi:hypothetical protein